MRAIILAAGRGERMGALTQVQPKPLLRVGKQMLIEYALQQVERAGIHDVMINVAYHSQQIIDTLGNGARYGVRIHYSVETERLEVGGGIIKALPFFQNQPFIAVSADVICDFPLQQLRLRGKHLAHLVLVDNPPYHPLGDFALHATEMISREGAPKFNYAGIGLYHPDLFKAHDTRFLAWRDIMWPAIDAQQVTGEYYAGLWCNVGTPQDIQIAQQRLPQTSLT